MGRCYLSQLLEECILLNSFSREVMKNFTINIFWKQSVPHPTSCKNSLFFNRKSEGIWTLITQFWVTKRLFVCYFWGFLHVSSSVTSPKFIMIHPSIYMQTLNLCFFLGIKIKDEKTHISITKIKKLKVFQDYLWTERASLLPCRISIEITNIKVTWRLFAKFFLITCNVFLT